jgi:predicted aldo/keto reductase-like oxidoreductase
MSATATAPSAPSAAPIEARLDSICKRQTARFLDHLEATRQSTPRLETDVKRLFGFVFSDIKQALQEECKEANHAQPAKQ